jgi:hypothetical protein
MSLPLISVVVVASLVSGVGFAHAGSCTAQVAHVERQIRHSAVNPIEGPTAPQTLAAQLSRQPTPALVQRAERRADALAAAALERAREADGDGNATACTQAVNEVKDLYGIV